MSAARTAALLYHPLSWVESDIGVTALTIVLEWSFVRLTKMGDLGGR